jgi:hypothetical protein
VENGAEMLIGGTDLLGEDFEALARAARAERRALPTFVKRRWCLEVELLDFRQEMICLGKLLQRYRARPAGDSGPYPLNNAPNVRGGRRLSPAE